MKEYFVRHYRDGNKEHVWIGDENSNPNCGLRSVGWSRNVSLQWRWWQTKSPAERLEATLKKAQRIVDEWNHREMFINHERELGTYENR